MGQELPCDRARLGGEQQRAAGGEKSRSQSLITPYAVMSAR
ncbi:hypothetical protein ACFQ2K_05990 [Streptomyces sanglieri]|uniref:Uncharacterized protein n=1 Tax=Streptomyces sanglieri TaxID=193460 RepID=A0ABW2WLE5_9ACTN